MSESENVDVPQKKVGDKVEWTLSAGTEKERIIKGDIVVVVPPGYGFSLQRLLRTNHIELNAYDVGGNLHMTTSLLREDESYIVAVPHPKGKGKPKLYYPKVAMLRVIEETDTAPQENLPKG